MAADNLNDIPPELKPLAPFLQRAQELKVKDPTMSYWCSYYAVQQGVHLKPRDKASRLYLMKLMAPLETTRNDPNTNVITNNDAACLYIEDFALRVFDAADNEDRRGEATRGTAKKFLAAANFLELLKVFEETPQQASGSNELKDANTTSAFSQHKDKIRYAKWKAADIAKAFREGRRPIPGPANAPEAMRRGAAAVESAYAATTAPLTALVLDGPMSGYTPQPTPFSRDSSSNNSPKAMSPVPGGSRSTSLSPRRRDAVLPLTTTDASGRILSPPPSATLKINGFPTPQSQPLVREPVASPPLTPSKGTHSRTHSAGFSFDNGRQPIPAPPKDILSLSTPKKDGLTPTGLYVANVKGGVSPGGWSTAATPGGFDDFAKRNVGILDQPSPSRVPDGVKRPEDTEAKTYPPRPYPTTPALPLVPLIARQGRDDSDDDKHVRVNGAGGGFKGRYPATPHVPKMPPLPDSSSDAKVQSENDEVGPLPGLNGRPPRKTVRWTPSVIGGTSTVASSSPPSSPGSPLGELPPLPDSDSSAGGEVRFSEPIVPGAASGDNKFPVPPRNPYAETPAARVVPPLPPKPANLPTPTRTSPPPAPPSLGTSSSQSTPSMVPLPLRRSPLPPAAANLPTERSASPKILSSLSQSNITAHSLAFPASSAPTSPMAANVGAAIPARHRRISSASAPDSSPPAVTAVHPGIKPFVPRFPPPNSADSSPSGSTLVPSSLGRPRATGYSPPPQKSATPPPAPTPRELPKQLPFRLISAAKKHSKFAASALDFDDLETARAELLAALAILNGEKAE